MDMLDAFRMLARYNRIANERLYEQCGKLDLAEYRRERRGSFGSIHGLLNHILLGDRIWMSRFAGGGNTTPPLNSILFETFAELQLSANRTRREYRSVLRKSRMTVFSPGHCAYTNSQGKDYVEAAPEPSFISLITRRIIEARCM